MGLGDVAVNALLVFLVGAVFVLVGFAVYGLVVISDAIGECLGAGFWERFGIFAVLLLVFLSLIKLEIKLEG